MDMTTKVHNPTPHQLVMYWHKIYKVPIGSKPNWLYKDRLELRMKLIKEEYEELLEAVDALDIFETVDALADLTYVIYGMAIEMGINLDTVLNEVQRSNMSKLDENGNPIFRADGKVLKGPNFSPPDLNQVIYYDNPEL